MHQMKTDFAMAVEEYNEAYKKLSKHMDKYYEKWKEQSDEFYK